MANELILIVEDNERNMKLARDVLQFKGFRTLEATTAAGGIELARAHGPALILMDFRLPDQDGIEALGVLRADPATARIPVIALTASAMKDDRERFLAAGFDGHMTKPIDIKTFADEVGQYLTRNGSSAT
jgi:two-component system cell cycle response regulator DivK